MIKRLRELDFLRGIAISLVLFRHIPLYDFTEKMGWIGVDLFFVLSGFLVSGLLFKEYIRFGNIQPKLFLIRRGFKIYPVYYLFYLPYLAIHIWEKEFYTTGFLSDITFTQNYVMGWGWGFLPAWSLAVEEHFYFGLSIFLWIAVKKNWYNLGIDNVSKAFVFTLVSVMAVCIGLRFIANFSYNEPAAPGMFALNSAKLFTLTHFRIDSLLTGVLIAYFYYFKPDILSGFVKKHSSILYILAALGLCWTPFVEPLQSTFAKTIGFTLVYTSFGILLITFLYGGSINEKLDKLFSKKVVNGISKIGFCSYSIYIIHSLVIWAVEKCIGIDDLDTLPVLNKHLVFVVAAAGSIVAGMMMTYVVEKHFLKVRDRFYPHRV